MRAPAQRFQDLIVWQKSHQLVLAVYRVTRTLPKEELFGLVSQMPVARSVRAESPDFYLLTPAS